jgi:hypothetical protein
MKNLNPVLALAILFSLIEVSCSAITGIFKAGMAFGIFMVVLAIVVVAAIIIKINKK